MLLAGIAATVVVLLPVLRFFKQSGDAGFNNWFYLIMLTGLLIWALVFTGLALTEYIRTMFSRSATLTISKEGIDDNLSIFSAGKIGWSQITGATITNALNRNFLVISVADAELIINRHRFLKKRVLRSSARRFGSPVVIPGQKIDFDLAALKEIIIKEAAGHAI